MINRTSFFLVLFGLFVVATYVPEASAAEKLQVTDLVVGTGDEAVRHSTVTVHYTGWLMDGTKFDSSHDHGQPFEFTLGSGQVIRGWDKGVEGMKVGGKRDLIIPPKLAYGSNGAGGVIPPDATLKFEVELVFVDPPAYQNVDVVKLKEMLADGVKIVDLRRQDEWDDTGVVEGSIKLTSFDGNGNFIQSFPGEFEALIDREEPVLLICRSGNRSSRIANALSEQVGYTNIYNVLGGIKAWIAAGYPVSK
ncbi:MAG: peptidylprolyl isomerase [Rhodospirillales bacterium]|jgi:rhodanese-related sulfurtransferase|nr:peptidylprolyl isomerase [Rhodospirillales bacterium]